VSCTWQRQKPDGEWRTYHGTRVFEGTYRSRGLRCVPSWNGGMFEALMPTLFLPEAQWAPRSWGVNHRLFVRAQIEHGRATEKGWWGFSPCANPEGGYREYGVKSLAIGPNSRSSDGVVTPHACFLALPFAPRAVLKTLAALERTFDDVYDDEYGFRDAVNVDTGLVARRVLMLDEGMILIAIANAVCDKPPLHYVSEVLQPAIRPLIESEEFTAGRVWAASLRRGWSLRRPGSPSQPQTTV